MMKKFSVVCCVLSVCFIITSQEISAQKKKSFWDKAMQVVDALTATDSTTVNKQSVQSKEIGDASFPEVKVTTPHSTNLEVKIQSITRMEKQVVVEFIIINKGDDLDDYRLSGCFGGCPLSKAYDNLGNECRIDLKFGSKESWHGGTAGNNLPNDVPVKTVLYLSEFDNRATSFSQVKINASHYGHPKPYPADGNFVFKNIPIKNLAEN